MGNHYLLRDPAVERDSTHCPGPHGAPFAGQPLLEANEIQGNILPGFHKPFQMLLFARIEDSTQARAWLRDLVPSVSSLAEVLAFNRLFKAIAQRHGSKASAIRASWINIGFSSEGLRKLAPEAGSIPEPAFEEGAWRRSAGLGDPPHVHRRGHPSNWLIGGPQQRADLCLLLADDEEQQLRNRTTVLVSALPAGVRLLRMEAGSARGRFRGREPFGFRDGISQPIVRGRVSERESDFLEKKSSVTSEKIAGAVLPPSWPGQFVIGYPGQNPEQPDRPGALVSMGPSWTRNGSFLVYRRLVQDVEAFESMVSDIGRELRGADSAFADWTPERVGAKLMGRWADGTASMVSPERNIPQRERSNEFGYTRDGKVDQGLRCPFGAHVRKANPRDEPRLAGSPYAALAHRILRRGLPFETPSGEVGIHFLAYQTSIENQFEFLMKRWMNDPDFPEQGAGIDPIAGSSETGAFFAFRARAESGAVVEARVELPRGLVVPTGGGYFFVPSISALKHLSAPV